MVITNTLEPGDLGKIVVQHGLLYSNEYGYDFTFEAYVAEPLAQFVIRNNQREQIWLVKINGDLVGTICICEVSDIQAQLRWFSVDPKARGKGVGKQLIDNALTFCRDKGYDQIVLWTVKGLKAAQSIYERNGFVVIEEVEREVWGSMQVEQCYQKYL